MRTAWTAELVKILTVRGLRVGALLAALTLPLTSLLVVSSGGLGDTDTVTSGAASGSIPLLLGYGAWAATAAGSEYSQRTIIVSLATVPRRPLLFGAKIAAAAAVAGAGAASGATLSLLLVAAVTPSGHALGDPAALLSIVLAGAAVAAVGSATGVLLRSSTGSIAIVLLALLLPKAAAGLLGGLQPWVVGSSPGTVVTQFVHGAQLSTAETYPGGTALAAVTMLIVAVAVVNVGGFAFARRDG
jgi:ABC-type transport system involved in multi-copper enzyme maturation permease subunit